MKVQVLAALCVCLRGGLTADREHDAHIVYGHLTAFCRRVLCVAEALVEHGVQPKRYVMHIALEEEQSTHDMPRHSSTPCSLCVT